MTKKELLNTIEIIFKNRLESMIDCKEKGYKHCVSDYANQLAGVLSVVSLANLMSKEEITIISNMIIDLEYR